MPAITALPNAPASLHLPPSPSLEAAKLAGFDFCLGYDNGKLSLWRLQQDAQHNTHPLCVDFLNGKLGYRLSQGRANQEALVKAAKGKHVIDGSTLLDATAGLGRDGALLAAAGFQVTMIERNPILAALLQDGLDRAESFDWRARITLQQVDACSWLQQATAYDVVYLDPMFSEGDSRAQVKKDLSYLRHLLADDTMVSDEATTLVTLARQHCKRRVVVKRAGKAPWLAGERPTASSGKGRAVRFDIYAPL